MPASPAILSRDRPGTADSGVSEGTSGLRRVLGQLGLGLLFGTLVSPRRGLGGLLRRRFLLLRRRWLLLRRDL